MYKWLLYLLNVMQTIKSYRKRTAVTFKLSFLEFTTKLKVSPGRAAQKLAGMGSGTKQPQTYYDILNVASDCSGKDIKSAYVKLSKQYHPDVKGTAADQQQTARFVKISEAYQTLSKTKSRQEYDEMLKAYRSGRIYETGRSMRTEMYRPWEIKPDFDPNPGPYYGVKGLNKTSNFKVAMAVTALGIAIGIFGIISVKHSFDRKQINLDEISAKAIEHHQRIRSEVQNSTREEQLHRVIKRINTNQAER